MKDRLILSFLRSYKIVYPVLDSEEDRETIEDICLDTLLDLVGYDNNLRVLLMNKENTLQCVLDMN